MYMGKITEEIMSFNTEDEAREFVKENKEKADKGELLYNNAFSYVYSQPIPPAWGRTFSETALLKTKDSLLLHICILCGANINNN